MNWKKLVILTLLFSLVGAVSVFADDVYEVYKAKQYKLFVNKTELNNPALVMEPRTAGARTVLPLRDLANTLQALIKQDDSSQTIQIYKPNVHIFLFVIKDKIAQTFSSVTKGGKYEFIIASQVDSLLTSVHSLKMTIVDPYGKEIESHVRVLKDVKDNFVYTTPTPITLEFKYAGNYKVKYYLKVNEESEYALVSEKVIHSVVPDKAE